MTHFEVCLLYVADPRHSFDDEQELSGRTMTATTGQRHEKSACSRHGRMLPEADVIVQRS